MAKRKGLTDKQVKALPRKSGRYVLADPQQRGLFLRVPTGDRPVAYTVIVKRQGRQIWESVSSSADTTIDEARARAHEVVRRIKAGKPRPVRPPVPQSVAATAENWLARHVDKQNLRSAGEVRRIVKKLIVPHVGNDDFVSLRLTSSTGSRIATAHGRLMPPSRCCGRSHRGCNRATIITGRPSLEACAALRRERAAGRAFSMTRSCVSFGPLPKRMAAPLAYWSG